MEQAIDENFTAVVEVRPCSDPTRGCGLHAIQNINAGDTVLTVKWGVGEGKLCKRIFDSVQTLSEFIQNDTSEIENGTSKKGHILEHCVPGVSGRVYQFNPMSLVAFENHSDNPNVSGMDYRWLDDGCEGDVFIKIALKDINEGEETLVDYNGCSGYDVRNDNAMVQFLQLCKEYGVVKRPSSFRIDKNMMA